MKRDTTGKFTHQWDSEPKQGVSLSLTQTAWQILEQQARQQGISKSELIERYARSLQPSAGPPDLENLTVAAESAQPTYQIAEAETLEASLRTSDALYRVLGEAVPDFVWLHDASGRTTYVNARWIEYTGLTLEEFNAQGPIAVIHPDDFLSLMAAWNRAEQQQQPFESEFRCRRKDGVYHWFMCRAVPLKDQIGQITQWIGLTTDIQTLKQAEAERNQLFLREQAIRTVAEAAERRATFLAEASRVLASSLEYETTLESVTHLAVPMIADCCVIDILEENGSLHRVAMTHADPSMTELMWEMYRRYPPPANASSGPTHVAQTGQSELVTEIPDHLLVAYAQDPDHLKFLRQLGTESYMVVPLIARDRILGTITLITTDSDRRYGPADLALAEDLGRRAANAVDNARLYRQTQEALRQREAALECQHRVEEKLTLLVEASSTLISSLELEALLPEILELSCKVIAADAYGVWRFMPSANRWEVVSSAGLSPAYQQEVIEVTENTPSMSDMPFVFEDVEQASILQSRWEGYRREGIKSILVLPLKIHGKSSGTLTFYYRRPHQFSETKVRVGLALANLSASAISTTELYQEQQRLRSQAEAANRIKDEFLAVLSHELRTPLNPILGWIRLLRGNTLDAVRTNLALETIERNAKLQTQLIEDLLDISRILQGKLGLKAYPVTLVPVITAAIETVRLAAEAKSIQIYTYLNPQVGQVLGDANRLQQVVWNLLSNAVKFTPTGGRIEVQLEQVSHQAQIRVTDTGQGIDPEFLPYMFDHFRQADSTTTRSVGGLGLGLAIARHLVELHGGVIQAASAGEGEGATFLVRLPLMQTADSVTHFVSSKSSPDLSIPAPQEPESSPRLTNLCILVVEDDPDTRHLLVFTLQQAGAIAIAAASAQAALEILESTQPDLLLTDIGMPEMDGYMLIRQVRSRPVEQGGQTPAIALTAYAAEVDRQRILAAGFQQHIAKPIEPLEVVRAIATLVKRTHL